MSDNRRSLEDLLAAFSHTWPYHLFWDSLEKHKACTDRVADCLQGVKEAKNEDDPEWKEQSLELAKYHKLESESHFKVAMEVLAHLEELIQFVEAIDPSLTLTKMLPILEVNSKKPSDDKIEYYAREVRALAGIIRAREPIYPPSPGTDPGAEVHLPLLLSAPDLARMLNMKLSTVESRLRRYRVKYPDCFREAEAPRENEPKYLYRTSDVLPELKRVKSTDKRRTD